MLAQHKANTRAQQVRHTTPIKPSMSVDALKDMINSMAEMRAFIDKHGLDIKKSGSGRTKEVIFAEIKETDVYKQLAKGSDKRLAKESDAKKADTDDMSSSLAKMRAFIDDHGLEIKTAGSGRTKEVIFAEIKETDAYKQLHEKKEDHDMSMNEMRAFIKEHDLDIKMTGLGRTKEVIYSEIQASDAYQKKSKVQSFTEDTPWDELNAFIQENGLAIKTRGKGRTKAVILKELEDAQKKDKAVALASAA